MSPRLTIVLPLKGRYLFTLRFLWHANRQQLPYRILIADGQVHPELAAILENSRKHFPALDIEYLRYPDDGDFPRFFAKMADATSRAQTPYAMVADNDDFVIRSGIDRSLDYLETHPDFVCCSGGIGGFSVYSTTCGPTENLMGPINRWSFRYAPFDRSRYFDSSSVTERLIGGLRYSWTFYSVMRASSLAKIWREVAEINFTDLQLCEKFVAARTLTLGKTKALPASFSYMRQYQTSMQSAIRVDWVHNLLRTRFSNEFAAIIERVSKIASEADDKHMASVAESLRTAFEPFYRDFLRLNYGFLAQIRRYLRTHAPRLVAWLKKRRRYSVALERWAIFGHLSRNGASVDDLRCCREALEQVEDVLSDDSFRAFVQAFVPKLSQR
jgi:glycosyltransferase domain-containing protein